MGGSRTAGRLIAIMLVAQLGMPGCAQQNVLLGADRHDTGGLVGGGSSPPQAGASAGAPGNEPEPEPAAANAAAAGSRSSSADRGAVMDAGAVGSATGPAGAPAMDAGPIDSMSTDSTADAAPTVDAGDGCELPFELDPLVPRDCSMEVCRAASRYEVRVRSTMDWYGTMAAQFWTLVVCRTGFVRNEAGPAVYGFTYPLTDAQLEALPDTAPVYMFYGRNPFDTPSQQPPVYRGPAAECGIIDTTRIPDCTPP